MTTTDLSKKLASWAERHSGTRSDFAHKLKNGIWNADAGTVWSLVNIREEFESRTSYDYGVRWLNRGPLSHLPVKVKKTIQSVTSAIETILPLTYLVPIAITWFHLQGVLDAYRASQNDLQPGETIDFLGLWSGARPDLYGGTQMSTVAVQVFWSIIAIAIFHILVSTQEDVDVIDDELAELILDIQLELSKSRAVTPQELSDSLTLAAKKLESALKKTTDSLESLNLMSSNMAGAANTLDSVSNSLSFSASSIENAVQPLVALPTSIDLALMGIGGLPEKLMQVQQKIDASTSNLSLVAEMMKNIAGSNQEVVLQSQTLLDGIRRINVTVTESVGILGDSAKVLIQLSEIVDGHRPHSVVMRETAEIMKEVRNSMDQIANEFKYSAIEYQRVNNEHRNQS